MTENKPYAATAEPVLVSIIMNCYNGERYLREAIDSVFAQSYGNWEIVFFDNASTDNSAAIARSYGEKLHYFCSEHTMPLGEARNAAVGNARGDLIAFLDTDDRWLPEKLAWQAAIFRKHPDVDFVYSNYYTLQDATGHTAIGSRRRQPSGDVFRPFLRHYPVNLQTVMVRGSALRRLNGLFDPVLEVSEEYDLFMRLVHASKAHYMEQPTAVYRVHDRMASIRHIDKYPVENEYVLGKLRSMIPCLDSRYPHEVAYLEAKIGYWRAAAGMHKGENAIARASLEPYKWASPVFFMLYCATLFPADFWKALQRLRRLAR
ncbi:MAG: glycosyltransferase [Nitrosomonadales bacterium]|nr:glycosyltransferase [Nitrosomonadales bacterium]